MSKNIDKCKEKLIFISSVKDKRLRTKLINLLWDKCMYMAIREIIVNADNNKIPLNRAQKNGLLKYRSPLRAISKGKKVNIKKFKTQLGGFWQMLIPAALSALQLLK